MKHVMARAVAGTMIVAGVALAGCTPPATTDPTTTTTTTVADPGGCLAELHNYEVAIAAYTAYFGKSPATLDDLQYTTGYPGYVPTVSDYQRWNYVGGYSAAYDLFGSAIGVCDGLGVDHPG